MPVARFFFVGTERGLEQRMLPKLGLPLATVDMVGIVGRGWKGRMQLVPRLSKSLLQAHRIIRKFKPDMVVGVGGYASVPVLLAAKLSGVPYMIHEQNAIPGLSNKLLSRWARMVCLSFAESRTAFRTDRIIVTGNPLRAGFEGISPVVNEQGKLLIFGGSRGARAINSVVVEMLPLLKQWDSVPTIIHQTGDEDFHAVQQAYRDAGYEHAEVVPFIDDMTSAYAEAALVICRAGATTLAELTVCGRAAILIPFPFAAADHQTANAKMLADAGAAIMLAQESVSATQLSLTVKELLTDRRRLQQMGANGRRLGLPDAAERILEECRKNHKKHRIRRLIDVRTD